MIEVRSLRRTFGDVTVLDDISFHVPAGRICGFIGPNGAGKTTTMRILASLDLPDGGSARIGGMDVVTQVAELRHKVGFMPDYYGSYADLMAAEYLEFFARAQGLTRHERERRCKSIIEFTELGPLLQRPVQGLSKGQKQRLSLARTLLSEPDLLILDEPAAGLDPRARIELRELLRVLASQGKTILISSHILSELADLIDWMVIIDDGQIKHAGAPGDTQGSENRGEVYLIDVVSDEEAARRFLLEQPCVLQVEGGEGELAVRIDLEREPAAELLARMIGHGVRARQFYRRQVDLEDVFMNVTRKRGSS